ncbi:MAG: hypothetical protein IJT25_02455 [Clostridia bacterium]|nr:hypothetical protein [Clostridia bacterium]
MEYNNENEFGVLTPITTPCSKSGRAKKTAPKIDKFLESKIRGIKISRAKHARENYNRAQNIIAEQETEELEK